MSSNNDRYYSFLKKNSDELAKLYLSGDENGAREVLDFLDSLPIELANQILYAFFAAQRQSIDLIKYIIEKDKLDDYGGTVESMAEDVLTINFLLNLEHYPDKKSKTELINLLGLENDPKFKKKIREIDVQETQKFFKYYSNFLGRATNFSGKKYELLKNLGSDIDFLCETYGEFNSIDNDSNTIIPIIYHFNYLHPLEKTLNDLDEFKENVEFMAKSIISQSEDGKPHPFIYLSNYITDSSHRKLSEGTYKLWDRLLFVYDRIESPELLNERASKHLLHLGRKIQKEYKICLNAGPTALRKQVKDDYEAATTLIKSAAEGRFPHSKQSTNSPS